MSETMSEEEVYKLARKRVQDKKDFVVHLCVYVVVNAMLVRVDDATGRALSIERIQRETD